MDFPKNRMKITRHKGTRTSEQGWLVLDIKGIDLDGVNEIVIPMADVTGLKEEPSTNDDPLSKLAQFLQDQQDSSKE